MPLTALLQGEHIESSSMIVDEWVQLKHDYRTFGLVMACGQAGIPKTSSPGTQFFAHKSGVDCRLHEGGSESPEYLATKAAVARAAREIGWEAGDVDNRCLRMPELVSRRGYGLEWSIKDILQGAIAPVAEFVATCAVVKTQMSKCWHCDRWLSLWAVLELDLESRCGERTTLMWGGPWPLWAPRRHE